MRRRRGDADSSIARRLPGFDARHATRRARRTRRLALSAILAGCAAALGVYLAGGFGHSSISKPPTEGSKAASSASTASTASSASSASSPSTRPTAPSSKTGSSPLSVTATLFPTQLGAPISDETVLAGPGTELLIMGGATTNGSLAQGIFTFDTASGALHQVGDLTTSLRDQAGAVISGQDVVFGGDSPASVTTVQAFPATSASGATSPTTAVSAGMPSATVVGALPQPRADGAVVTLGSTTYVVGGDNGSAADPAVLATTNESTFRTVASLPVPVRFPAVAALGRTIYVFGGEVLSTSGSWSLVTAIQSVIPAAHKAKLIGHMPEPLSEASAVTVEGRILVLGGLNSTSQGASGASAISASSAGNSGTLPAGPALSTISWFDPSGDHLTSVGRLPVAVARAGTAVIGSTAWLVGGESGGVPVSSVQSVAVSVPTRHVSGKRKTNDLRARLSRRARKLHLVGVGSSAPMR